MEIEPARQQLSTLAAHSAPASHRPDADGDHSPRTETSTSNVSHKVTNWDTLAGLAIRYNVAVADIKRANGLLSDNALYARDVIQIPTAGLQPLGDKVVRLVAQVASGLGRDPVLNAEDNLHPASAASERAARILNAGENLPPYPDDPSLPWWCHCGTCDPEDEVRTTCRTNVWRRSSMDGEQQEYEMQDRNGPYGVLLPPEQSAGPTRMLEHMRRRRQHSDSDLHTTEQRLLDGSNGPGRPPRLPYPYPSGADSSGQQGEGITTVMRQLVDLGKAFGAKIRAAANQSALATPQIKAQSLAAAADAVLGSVREACWQPPRRQSAPGAEFPLAPSSQRPSTSVPTRKWEGGKTD